MNTPCDGLTELIDDVYITIQVRHFASTDMVLFEGYFYIAAIVELASGFGPKLYRVHEVSNDNAGIEEIVVTDPPTYLFAQSAFSKSLLNLNRWPVVCYRKHIT